MGKIKYKFKVGDIVEVIHSGDGVSPEELLRKVKIEKLGIYMSGPGYSVFPKIGNSRYGWCDGFIGEESFKLITNIKTSFELWER